jgi:CBS domain-containing protein
MNEKTPSIDNPELSIIADFLRDCLPFNDLPQTDFATVVNQLEVTYYPQGYVFDPDTDIDGLRIVRSGAVELRDENNRLLDRLGEGESFNLAGLNKEEIVGASVIEDCLIYLLRSAHYQAMRTQHRHIDRFFSSQRSRRLRRAARHEPDPSSMMRHISSLMSTKVLTVAPTDSITQAAKAMDSRRVSCALVMDAETICGIITDRDLRSRVLAAGHTGELPVSQFMTRDPQGIEADSTVFDATLFMTRHNYHHLPVMQEGKLAGIITTSDLMLARQDDPVYLVQHVSRQTDIEGLRAVVNTMPNLLVQWVTAGVRANQVGHILTAISDAVTARLIEMYMQSAGPAPVPFCWLGFGSQARGEQLINADQDNGLLISNELREEDKPWFEKLAHSICDGLDACGYIYCPGKVMATTDEWRQTLNGWKNTVDRWTRSPTPDAVMRVSIFFDLRAVYGDAELCRQLQEHMLETAARNSIFLAALAANVLDSPAPLGIFRRFLVERNGEHRDTLDLKKRGVIPIIDIVRIHALANKITAVNTDDRLRELARNKVMTINDSRNLQDALHFIMQLRINSQAKQVTRGEKTSNQCNPNDLPKLAKEQLRDAFTIVDDAQTAVRLKFRAGLG